MRLARIAADDRQAPVWVRKTAVLGTCPKSYISAASESLVEEFFVREAAKERTLISLAHGR